MQQELIDWLLAFNEPGLSYRVLTEWMGKAEDEPDVLALKASIAESETVKGLFAKMHPDGYWLQKDYKGFISGDGERYGSFGTTHFVLSYLSELGMDRNDERIEKAVDRYLNLQQEDGSWNGHFSCRYSYNVRTFVKIGFRDDLRVQRSINLMLSTEREDGGYLCDMHAGKYKTRETKSCVRGSNKALLAFADLPEYWQHPRVLQLVDYYLRREVLWSTKNPAEFVNKDLGILVFPIVWRSSLWEPIYALSKMGYGDHPNMQRAWEVLDSRLDEMGRVPLDFTPTQAPWKVGKRGEPNPWLTFYVQLAKKYRHQ
ncbi:MAG: prenyltransferase/squalene oxidase repeat-containing protein [Anaerolineae bacterium]|jgi:hypothetical protein|nr:prenyltransferase/squalene oxidase repeat-containing protein [Anaerolineae bacterium]